MNLKKILAIGAALAVTASALVATDAASADVKTFTNQIVADPQIRTVALEVTPRTLTASLTIDNLQFEPTRFNFYLMPADTVANASATTERVFQATHPDEPGGTWGADSGYVRGTSGPDQPGSYTGSFTLATTGSVSTATLSVTDPVALPWSGPTWIAVTFYKSPNYYNAGVIESDGQLHGFGPVSDLSIPTSLPLSLSTPSQTFGVNSATVSGSVQPAAPGSVQLFDGATSVGSTTVTEAAPSFAIALPNSLAVGVHSLHAVFTPTTSRFAIATSAPIALSVVVPKKETSVRVTLSHSTQHYRHTRAKATITVSGRHAGTVRVYDGTHRLRTLKLHHGKATYTFSSKLSKKKHAITVVFLPKDVATYARSTSKKIVLRVVR